MGWMWVHVMCAQEMRKFGASKAAPAAAVGGFVGTSGAGHGKKAKRSS
jgi:hypothetical protein